MKTPRRRHRMVPMAGVEVFEARSVLYFDEKTGQPMVGYHVDTPDNSGADKIPIHEVLGVMAYAMLCMVSDHLTSIEDEEAEGT